MAKKFHSYGHTTRLRIAALRNTSGLLDGSHAKRGTTRNMFSQRLLIRLAQLAYRAACPTRCAGLSSQSVLRCYSPLACQLAGLAERTAYLFKTHQTNTTAGLIATHLYPTPPFLAQVAVVFASSKRSLSLHGFPSAGESFPPTTRLVIGSCTVVATCILTPLNWPLLVPY